MMIRNVRQEDAEAIAAISGHHVLHGTATFDTVPPSVAAITTKISDYLARGWPFLVAETDGAVIGYANAAQFRGRSAYAFTCENSIYIDANNLGQGIGKALLGALLVAAAAAGFRQMIAVITGDGAASIALHDRLGFRHIGRMQSVGRKFGQWLDTVDMQIALGAGDNEAPPYEPQ